MNPSVEAALIGVSGGVFGAGIAAAVGIVGVRNTRKVAELAAQEERRLRLFDRRADAYQDALSDLLARRAERRQKFSPINLDISGILYAEPELPPYDLADWAGLAARLTACCSPAVRAAYDSAREADEDLVIIYRLRTHWSERASQLTGNEPDVKVKRLEIGRGFAELESRKAAALKRSDTLDEQLMSTIRSELSPDTPSKPPR